MLQQDGRGDKFGAKIDDVTGELELVLPKACGDPNMQEGYHFVDFSGVFYFNVRDNVKVRVAAFMRQRQSEGVV